MWCTLATLLRGTMSRSAPIALPLVRSVESATVAAAQSERPGYAPYQQQGGGDQFSADWFVERFKVLLNGGKLFSRKLLMRRESDSGGSRAGMAEKISKPASSSISGSRCEHHAQKMISSRGRFCLVYNLVLKEIC